MKKIEGFENVKEAGGQIENLPAGAYICDIKQCREVGNRNGNGTHLEIMFDVCRGDYRGWFERDWNLQNREDKYWHGIIRQNVPDESSPKYNMQCGFFKRFTNVLEESNPGYHWDWNEAGLKGKLIGIVFGEVEKESQRGTRYMITRADNIINTQAVESGKYNLPKPKMMENAAPAISTFAALPEIDGDLPF